ncbi:MAG TPA: phosphopantetheine-binding protein, partial [Candidatus Sulfotelmatobacter sp.]|nr:phosphopantetheine-binding protein [Candidatus Sulfotelmatobacter sp.]
DGTLEILGRVDDQVKIHGVRVEPAEVSAVLARHPSVESCFVVARKNEQDETCLVAYVVASKQEKKTNTLRSYLVKQLPAAMIPAFFVFLDSLPLTSNGKVNRSALPAPDQSMPALEKTFVVPRTPVEKLMADIWSDLLKLERVGIRDNFFEIGGHSLIATQFVSRIRRELNLEIPLRAIFEMPTIESLAFHLLEQQAKAAHTDEVVGLLAELDSLPECVPGSKT